MANGCAKWLNASYATHGNSTSSGSKPTPKNMNDTPKAKVAAIGKQTTDMAKTKTAGNKSGGGSSSISKKSPEKDSKTVYPDNLTTSRKQ